MEKTGQRQICFFINLCQTELGKKKKMWVDILLLLFLLINKRQPKEVQMRKMESCGRFRQGNMHDLEELPSACVSKLRK